METDFLDAFSRHWKDAETLFDLKRWANADHLYGLAAECALKKLMLCCNMPFDEKEDRPENPKDRKHINAIWRRYSTYQSGVLGRSYALSQAEPFSDWMVEQRYHHQRNFTESRVAGHRGGASEAKRLLDKARREGMI